MSPLPLFEVVGVLNRYLGSEIPKQVNKRIEAGLEVVLEDMEGALKKAIFWGTAFDFTLLSLSITACGCVILGHFKSLLLLWHIILIGSPLVMVLRHIIYFGSRFKDLHYLEHGITAVITEALQGADVPRKFLVKFYESRSTEELVRTSLGAFLLNSFDIVKQKRSYAVLSVLSFLIAYACMLWVFIHRLF